MWGSDEVNVEGWKPLKRLVGHESGTCARALAPGVLCLLVAQDVTDVGWSPGDRYLASVGLDSAVLIWCGFTLGMCCLYTIVILSMNCAHRAATQD